jgi:streptogramin lyase
VVELLEPRRLLSVNIAEFPIRVQGGAAESVASGAGSDKNVWFTLSSNSIGMINPQNTSAGVTQYPIPTYNSGPGPITAGPDGNYWFFEQAADQFGVINPNTGAITEIPFLANSDPQVDGMTAGPNGAVWFTEFNSNEIGMINVTTHQITQFPVITPGSEPYGIVQGPDGNIWFTESGANQIGRINPTTHVMQEFLIDSTGNDQAEGITVGSDQNLWFTVTGTNKIGVMNPTTGNMVNEYNAPTTAAPNAITSGSDGNLWFTEPGLSSMAWYHIGMVTPSGTVKDYGYYACCGLGPPNSITGGPDNNLWFTAPVGGGITSLNPISHAFTPRSYSSTNSDSATGIVADSNGNLWFTQQNDDQVGVFTPATAVSREFAVPTGNAGPLGIALGPDNNVWFTEAGVDGFFGPIYGDKIGWVNPSNDQVKDQAVTSASAGPHGIVADPADGNLWFTEYAADKIGRINPTTKALAEFSVPTAGAGPEGIAVDQSGNIWFTEKNAKKIAELSPDDPNQSLTEYAVPGNPFSIVAGPDGNIWFTEDAGGYKIAVFSPASDTVIAQYPVSAYGGLPAITVGPDQNLWFTDSSGKIGMITTGGTITEYPVSNADPVAIASGLDGNIWFTGTGTSNNPNVIGVVTLASSSIPTQLAVTTQPPGAATSGKGFGLVVSVENSAGNPDLDYSGSVTIALSSNPGSDTLKGTLTEPVENSVAVFSGLTLKNAATGYTIQATATGLSPVTTNPFNVTLGATKLLVTGQPPSSVLAGTLFGLTVTAEDGQGNVDTSYNGPITLTLGNHPNGSTLGGVLVVGADNGVATFTGLSLNLPANDYTILSSSGTLTSATSIGFNVTAGPATQLVVATDGGPPASILAGGLFNLTFDAEDQYTDLATGFNGSVTVALVNSAGVTLHGNLIMNAAGGVVTFSGLSIDTVGDYTIQATSSGLTSATTSFINVTAGAATQLVVAPGNPPGSLVAGTQFGFVVDAEDQFSNIDPTFGAKVAIALVNSPGVTLHGSPDAFAQRGIATFSDLSIDTVGTYTIEATSGSLTPATTGSITITPGAPFKLAFAANLAGTVTAGQVFAPDPVIDEEDQFGNLETSDNSTVIMAAPTAGSARLQGNSATVSGGIATFNNLIDTEAQTMMLQFTGGGLPALTSSAIDVLPGVASQLVVKRPPSGIVAGTEFPLEVDAEDAYTNLATSFNGSVNIGLVSGQGSLTGNVSVTAVSGVANFTNLTCDTSGSISIGASASSGGNTISSPPSGSGPIVVNPGVVDHFVVTTTFASTDVAGTVGTVTVTAEDQNNNVVGSGPNQYEAMVNLVSTDPKTAGLPNTYAFTASDAGTHTFANVTLETLAAAGSQTITASDRVKSTVTGDALVNVIAATAHGFAVTTSFPGPDVAGTVGTVTVTALDEYGNVAGSGPNQYEGMVDLLSTDPKTTGLPNSYAFTGGDAGSHTFTGVTLDTVAATGSQTITATDLVDSTISGQATVDVVPDADYEFVVTTNFPSSDAAGTLGTITVTAEDKYGNVAGSGPNQYEGRADLASTDAKTTGLPSNYAFTAGDAGTHTFANVTLETVAATGSQTITATDLVDNTVSGKAVVNVVPAPVYDLVVTTSFPNPDPAGTVGTVTVTAQDRYGNTVRSGPNQYAGKVNLVSADPKTSGLPAAYTFIAGDAGSHTFTNVILETAGSQTITATDSVNSTLMNSQQINVTALAPDQLVLVAQPPSTVSAATGFGFEVAAEDMYGNIHTTFAGPVSAVIGTNPGGAALSGKAQVTAVAGIANFSGLALTKVGVGYTLKLSSGSLTTVTTNPFNVTALAPTVTSEKVVLTYPPTKKGKPRGAPIAWGYVLQYSGPMATPAGFKSNYQVEFKTTNHGKTVLTPVTFMETYSSSKNTVTLKVSGKNPFAKGGQINILASSKSGVTSQAGVLMNPKYTVFQISPGGGGITLG